MKPDQQPPAPASAPSEPGHCENCAAVLHGHYCHQCGQSLHSPIRHAGHALEEVFESFWHLDGRVFRTLRDLLVPGRTAIAYLAGHRVRYIAPMRMFVILTLLTFFVGKLTVHLEGDAITFDDQNSSIGRAQTVAEVERIRDAALADIRQAEADGAKVPGVNVALTTARTQVQGQAAARIAVLRQEARRAGPDAGAGSRSPAASGIIEVTAPEEPRPPARPFGDESFQFNDKPWHPTSNPVRIDGLPGFANAWLNQRIGRAKANIERMDNDADQWLQAFMGALPTALFVLMPIFALLLKLFYIGTRRLYLEHLVVALYSHAFLLLTLLALFLVNALQNVLVAGAVVALNLVEVALYAWMPIYLLLMQKRVYAQGWWLTVPKYLVLGAVYFMLVTFAIVYAVFAGLTA
ncbi:DUF3667 domain-containing protein [Lysobacter koreensis]|uniref:DUF3667 domain-containing protein n=1 Tax=Lysobacter koreensis TaxID=266122 RepID=A0ABW2YM92_9GAMM